MMEIKASLFARFVVAISFIGNALADSPRPCPGGYADGTETDVGRYWYECRDGQMIPKGCLTEDGRRVSIDETFDTRLYRMKCVRNGDYFMTVTYVGCMHRDTGRDVGSQWDDGTAYYTCEREGSNVHVITLGCNDQGRRVKLDERVAKNDFIYQCKQATDGTPTMNKVGCVHEGRKYDFGETFDGPKFWYTCLESGPKIFGCMHESRRFSGGDFITNDDETRSRCRVDGENTDFEIYTCLAQDESGATIEKTVGCTWIEGSDSEAYWYLCKQENSKLTKVRTQCMYRQPRGRFAVDPGCVRLSPVGAIGCVQDTGSRLQLKMEIYSADRVDSLPGLRRC
jgi:hypothetical protein